MNHSYINAGTSEGAKKGWETRRGAAASTPAKVAAKKLKGAKKAPAKAVAKKAPAKKATEKKAAAKPAVKKPAVKPPAPPKAVPPPLPAPKPKVVPPPLPRAERPKTLREHITHAVKSVLRRATEHHLPAPDRGDSSWS